MERKDLPLPENSTTADRDAIRQHLLLTYGQRFHAAEHFAIGMAADRFRARVLPATPDGIERAADLLAKEDTAAGLYASGYTLTHEPDRGRGKAEDIAALCTLSVDLDVTESGQHSGAADLETIADAISHVGLFPLEPSVLVNTGHGIQAHWVLEDPAHGGVAQVLAACNRDAWRWLADAHGGKGADPKAFDATRVWRVPGTVNRKDDDDPRPVKVIGGTDERVQIEDWISAYELVADRYEPAPTPEPEPQRALVSVGHHCESPIEAFNRGADFDALLAEAGCQRGYRNLWRRPGSTHDDPNLEVKPHRSGQFDVLHSYGSLQSDWPTMDADRQLDPFGVLLHGVHGGNMAAAIEDAKRRTGWTFPEASKPTSSASAPAPEPSDPGFQPPPDHREYVPGDYYVDQAGRVVHLFRIYEDGTQGTAADAMAAVRSRYVDPAHYNEDGTPLRAHGGYGPLVLPKSFFERSATLARIYREAMSRSGNPEAVLMNTLARVALATPPSVTLPGLGGSGSGSLNLMMFTVATTGGGKGATEAIAKGLLPLPTIISDAQPSSAQGLVQKFLGPDDDPEAPRGQLKQVHQAVGFSTSESTILQHIAEHREQGPIFGATLRQLAVGESVGQSNAKAERDRHLDAGSYRCTFSAYGQPHTLAWLLDPGGSEELGGTLSRFMWSAKSIAPKAKGRRSPSPPIAPLDWIVPVGPITLTFPESAIDDVELWSAVFSHDDGSVIAPRDSYWSVNRMKLAACLALLEDPTTGSVSDDDWRRAGLLMDYSDAVRSDATEAVVNQRRDAARAMQVKLADDAKAVQRAKSETLDQIADDKSQRVADRIAKKLADCDCTQSGSELRRFLSSSYREHFEDGIAVAIAKGDVAVVDGADGSERRATYRHAASNN